MKFPIISLLITGKHTEIVLTRGVGLHTILGMTIDIAAGNCIDKAFRKVIEYIGVLEDKEKQNEFVKQYNSKNKETPIPSGFYDFLQNYKDYAPGHIIEQLAKFGDPS